VRIDALRVLALIVSLWWAAQRPAAAATFTFGSNANGLVGQAGATLISGEFEMQLTAGPSGAGLRETGSPSGLGVSSIAISGVLSDTANAFGLLHSSDPLLDGGGEFVQFAWDRPGILTGLNFDGISDERLELFVLQTPSGRRINFVDSRANMPDSPHPVFEHPLDAAVSAGAVVGEIVYLWEVSGLYDDEVYGLRIPFAVGQTFTLTFGAAGLPYSQDSDFAARLQGIEVQVVPEPATWLATLTAGGLLWLLRRRTVDLAD